jgi:hypothetical protein
VALFAFRERRHSVLCLTLVIVATLVNRRGFFILFSEVIHGAAASAIAVKYIYVAPGEGPCPFLTKKQLRNRHVEETKILFYNDSLITYHYVDTTACGLPRYAPGLRLLDTSYRYVAHAVGRTEHIMTHGSFWSLLPLGAG